MESASNSVSVSSSSEPVARELSLSGFTVMTAVLASPNRKSLKAPAAIFASVSLAMRVFVPFLVFVGSLKISSVPPATAGAKVAVPEPSPVTAPLLVQVLATTTAGW